ncbi:hypothetical protein [Clostridium sp. DJ247]|uniref:hypothetical protein n=1 Tax=Clostridium sp. DJ247 TaxID=2726188 RepID=UPI0016265323|nr:hypothetical protein [Clostridium sp. DJ247]MBC2580449.1 hypothetical protein [Clostridium sp. DJ247]
MVTSEFMTSRRDGYEMIQSSNLKWSSELRLQGLLYMFLSELVENADRSNFTKENQ